MKKLIELNNARISIGSNEIIRDFSFELFEGLHTSIIGPSGSGKSTILKSLARRAHPSNLRIADIDISNDYNYLHQAVAVVFYDTPLMCHTVYHELSFALENLNWKPKKINDTVKAIAKEFKILDILDYDPKLLSTDMQIYIKIIAMLIFNPRVIGIDDLFIYLTDDKKDAIYKYINKNNLTLLLVTSNIEDTLYTDYIYIINARQVIAYGNKENIYNEEKLLNKLGIGLPFIVDLSKQLTLYGVVDKVYTDRKALIGDLWK